MTTHGSHRLLRAFCDELARSGAAHACTSPGSRSTPIVLALTREPALSATSHIDERSAAFFALGLAKATGRPAILACTSGTAAANYLPAVVEAHQARVPMIVLTADRPPELRDNGAGQAIDQLKLYGDAVRWFVEVAVEEATPGNLRWIRALACRAYQTATGARPGPVHLNFPLREPLVPDSPLPADPVPGRPGGRPWLTATRAPDTAPGAPALAPRGVVVAGREERDPAFGSAVADFAQRLGYALLADPLSGARRGEAAIATYDLLLRDSAFTAAAAPELVLRVGDLPTSKPLRTWLESLAGVPQIAIDPEDAWQDPAGVLSERVIAAPRAVLDAWSAAGATAGHDSEWLELWRAADRRVTSVIEAELGHGISEPLVARRLGDWLPAEANLIVASSMPIRDVELFLGTGHDLPRVLANRGANGIDGTVSTALGVAAAGRGPTVLLIGDVALAHDVGGLLAARRLGLALTIVLINNDGGGIFSFLPVATQTDAFEQHVATPHGLDFARVAALYGCAHVPVTDPPGLRAAVDTSLRDGRTTIIETRTDRATNLALHRRIAAQALAAVSR